MAEKQPLGISVLEGNLHHYSDHYCGTEQDLGFLRNLKEDPGFKNNFPHHRVFFVGSEVVGYCSDALPFKMVQARAEIVELYEALDNLGLTPFNCAIITTSLPTPIQV